MLGVRRQVVNDAGGAKAAFAVLRVPLSTEALLIVEQGAQFNLWTEDARVNPVQKL